VRRLLANRFVLALLVLAALAAVFGLATVSRPAALAASARAPVPTRASVSSVLRACPAPGSAGGTASVAVATSSAGSGRAEVTRLSAGTVVPGAPLSILTQPGRPLVTAVPAASVKAGGSGRAQQSASGAAVPTSPGRGGVVIQASGAMARGLEVEQTGTGGLPTARCDGPGTDFWFVGPGVHSAADIQLYLMNTDSEPADAAVDVFTDSGPLIGSTDSGITVPPHGMVVQTLAPLVKGSHAVALNVTTSIGQVVAAVMETSSAGKPGVWLPVAQPPATSQVLPGLPASVGSRELYVAVPGANNAQVKVTAVTGRGSYQPTGGSGIDLPGGSAVGISLPSLGGIPCAIMISSNVPVTAAMVVSGGAPGAPGAVTAASAALHEQGVIADNPTSGGSAVLVLSAPNAAARVRVGEETAAGPAAGGGQLVAVPAGRSVVVRLRAPRGSGRVPQFAVVITPLAGSGPLYAGWVFSSGGTTQAIIPVDSSLSWVPLPPVHSSLTTALP
jgi:Family of unknown function (DUF5719)